MPEAGRIITGTAGGLRLEGAGSGTRPISDRVKQALFAMLASHEPEVWSRPVLDLFAGSGALGIEALSRGAPQAVLVERESRAASAIGRNLERAGLTARARIVRRDVAAFLLSDRADVPEAPFGLAFADPPYERTADLARALERLGDARTGWLDGAALVVAKHFWKTPPPERTAALELLRVRRFGETALSMYRRIADPVAGGE